MSSIHPIAPHRAARLAVRWFATPSRKDAPPEKAASGPGPRPLSIEWRGGRLAAWSSGDGPPVLLVHGWNGRGLQLAPLAAAIAARGHRAVAFDHPGHGRSSGRTVTIPEMAEAIRLVSERVGGAHALVAHSLGAAAATYALSRGLPAGRAVFLAPPVRPDRWLIRFGRALGLPASAEDDLVTAIEARAGVPIAAIRPLELAPSLATRLLIIHDRGDREVPYADGQELAQAWPGARLVTTEGLGHTRLLSDPKTIELVADFIGEPRAGAGLRDPHLTAYVEKLASA